MRSLIVLVTLLLLVLSTSIYFVNDYKINNEASAAFKLSQLIFSFRVKKTVILGGSVVLGSSIRKDYGNCNDLPYLKYSNDKHARLIMGPKPADWVQVFSRYLGGDMRLGGNLSVNLYCKIKSSVLCGCDDFLYVDRIIYPESNDQ